MREIDERYRIDFNFRKFLGPERLDLKIKWTPYNHYTRDILFLFVKIRRITLIRLFFQNSGLSRPFLDLIFLFLGTLLDYC